MADPQDDLRYTDSPPGFVVLRENELDPDHVGMPSGLVCLRRRTGREPPNMTDPAQVDAAIAEALARKHAIHREIAADRAETRMRVRYTVERDTP